MATREEIEQHYTVGPAVTPEDCAGGECWSFAQATLKPGQKPDGPRAGIIFRSTKSPDALLLTFGDANKLVAAALDDQFDLKAGETRHIPLDPDGDSEPLTVTNTPSGISFSRGTDVGPELSVEELASFMSTPVTPRDAIHAEALAAGLTSSDISVAD